MKDWHSSMTSTPPDKSPFDRCRLARRQDFSKFWNVLFSRLERHQTSFLKYESAFRSLEYPWARDALHCWSRAWEYPFVFHHIQQWRATVTEQPLVVDLGSGVTFFPFALASEEDVRVLALDVDPVCVRDLTRATQLVRLPRGSVTALEMADSRIPLADNTVDCLYCVSVLEHVEKPHHLIKEVGRVLKPKGLFILTMDICFDGQERLTPSESEEIFIALNESFEWWPHGPQEISLSVDENLLTSQSSPFPRRKDLLREGIRTFWRRARGRDVMQVRLPNMARWMFRFVNNPKQVAHTPAATLGIFGGCLIRK